MQTKYYSLPYYYQPNISGKNKKKTDSRMNCLLLKKEDEKLITGLTEHAGIVTG
jgi:hypothetical protein